MRNNSIEGERVYQAQERSLFGSETVGSNVEGERTFFEGLRGSSSRGLEEPGRRIEMRGKAKDGGDISSSGSKSETQRKSGLSRGLLILGILGLAAGLASFFYLGAIVSTITWAGVIYMSPGMLVAPPILKLSALAIVLGLAARVAGK